MKKNNKMKIIGLSKLDKKFAKWVELFISMVKHKYDKVDL